MKTTTKKAVVSLVLVAGLGIGAASYLMRPAQDAMQLLSNKKSAERPCLQRFGCRGLRPAPVQFTQKRCVGGTCRIREQQWQSGRNCCGEKCELQPCRRELHGRSRVRVLRICARRSGRAKRTAPGRPGTGTPERQRDLPLYQQYRDALPRAGGGAGRHRKREPDFRCYAFK